MEKIKRIQENCILLICFAFMFVMFGIICSGPEIDTGLIDLNKILSDPKEDEAKINCNRPLSELCFTMRDAVACGVTPYCIHCNWITSFNPNDASFGKCKRCQIAIKDGRYNELLPNFDYPKVLRPICNLHIKKEDAVSCSSNIEHYFATREEFWSTDPLKLNALETCSILGLCYSPFAIILPQNSDLLIERAIIKPGRNDVNFISHNSIRNVGGAKVVPFDSNYTKFEQKFLPIFKPSCSKHVCSFLDVKSIYKNSDFGIYAYFIYIGGIVVIVGAIVLIVIKCANKSNKVDDDEIDFCDDVDDEKDS